MAFVKIHYNCDEILLPLTTGGNLKLSVLKQYFPSAVGLTYIKDGHSFGVKIKNPIISKKRKLVEEMLSKLPAYDQQILGSSKSKNTILNNPYISMLQFMTKPGYSTSASTSTPQGTSSKKQELISYRKILVGWLRNQDGIFKQVLKPLGGVKQLSLEVGKNYTVEDITVLATQEFEKNSDLSFDKYKVLLGHFNGSVISNFKNGMDQETKRFVFYLLTFLKNEPSMVQDISEPSKGKLPFQYTKDKSIACVQKEDLYQMRYDDLYRLTIDEFDPFKNGFRVAEISTGGKILLNIYTDPENLQREFLFPAADIIEDEEDSNNNHYIIHDVDELNGYCENKLGVGVITNCKDRCKFVFVWYKDEKLFEQGQFRYWISGIDVSSTYRCVIKCQSMDQEISSGNFKYNDDENSSKSTLMDNALCILKKAQNSTITSIKKEKLIIFKELLGAGAQGKVKKGRWNGTDVAVKTIILSESNLKLACREIKILEVVRHPNFIQLMAYCTERDRIHLIMELCESTSLNDIRFVKICDLGLSKFKKMTFSLKSTIGRTRFVRGTPLYMAPELLLENSEANVYSDVWALGCTLVELYSEKTIWGDTNSEDGLKMILRQKKIPDLSCIPQYLRSVLSKCFSYDCQNRPSVLDILECYANLGFIKSEVLAM
ncbi:Similar to SIS8: Probable serine/threonine-protein kinase SIS8 (Arabidopsis thaliana) [Cotesia congregata]|uniref:Similar to SIS8: Probable serine/threonine-protein kinase SIS8 (Arabidopsis thaliana) n=1 Tax=Cotesia congregata TaxID=51543 RepID=A0A8J2HC14_COTCN|nr:Similar to SIS8: Probable serine/threonine-protein kinase SIS8 (Arabidopsis thaliana) [Cotesia congregata]